ncbi:hypothetical protein M2323_001362 [Rhodoblastus acidophilus]|uniref:hypothetical protein n=1 Tax=Rhodoblastus acidophilus TaxID=1074 RepID=UPI0022248E40|nr:hypothetical protein [Rhodoblastus acidophilus]MCW2283590.1 hypothetical protein [Rhodoblastus acidophilus]MCW2332450.1 hypothetical protein [Rhodoblastus acidophilus]
MSGRRIESLDRWTRWRAQLPLTLFTVYFLPVVALWGPAWSGSGRLTAQTLALALVLLILLVLASGWLIDRLALAVLLRGCATLDRAPTRSEQQASSGRVGQSFANRNAAPLVVRWACLVVGVVALMVGLHGDDMLLILSGALLGALFALGAVRDSCARIHLWLLFDAVHFEAADR